MTIHRGIPEDWHLNTSNDKYLSPDYDYTHDEMRIMLFEEYGSVPTEDYMKIAAYSFLKTKCGINQKSLPQETYKKRFNTIKEVLDL